MSPKPAVKRPVLDERRDHILGPPSAPATLLEYGDFECPHCGQAHLVIKALQLQLGTSLRFAFRHFPLAIVHPHAQSAAEAAETAGAQDRFWDMHDTLFENQQALDDVALLQYAAFLNLDVTRFVEELASHVYQGRVREDFMLGAREGVNGTPTFFINGRRHDSTFDFETLLSAIESEIATTTGRH
jgi:protein-disulfide isomerase